VRGEVHSVCEISLRPRDPAMNHILEAENQN
jgi:hypothetical protein